MSTSSIRSDEANAETTGPAAPEGADRANAPASAATASATTSKKGASSQSQPKAERFVRGALSWSRRAARVLGRFMVDVVTGSRITRLLPTAPFVLRGAGLAVAVMALVYPIFTLAIPGALGWLAEVIVNLLVAYLLFVMADALCALDQLSGNRAPQDSAAEE